MPEIKSICVYCGSSAGNNPTYREAGLTLGRALAKHKIRLIYGGGSRGIMGAVAEGAMQNGGDVLGIIPKFLIAKEASAASINDLGKVIVTQDMHERKHLMFQHSDAFVTLPGGIGTVEEIVEMMTWAQLGRHKKPMVFANINQFWQPMLALIDHMRNQGFIHTNHQLQPLVIDDVQDIIPAILAQNGRDKSGDADIISRM